MGFQRHKISDTLVEGHDNIKALNMVKEGDVIRHLNNSSKEAHARAAIKIVGGRDVARMFLNLNVQLIVSGVGKLPNKIFAGPTLLMTWTLYFLFSSSFPYLSFITRLEAIRFFVSRILSTFIITSL